MKHPDDTVEAIEFMRKRAQFLIDNGTDTERALKEAISYWERSLERAQAINRFNADLRASGKPTLRVPLFEAVAAKRR